MAKEGDRKRIESAEIDKAHIAFVLLNGACSKDVDHWKATLASCFPILNLREYIVVFEVGAVPHRAEENVVDFFSTLYEVAGLRQENNIWVLTRKGDLGFRLTGEFGELVGRDKNGAVLKDITLLKLIARDDCIPRVFLGCGCSHRRE